MTENKYRVVLTGELADGKSESEVTARMAALFKTSADKIGMLLKKQGAVIKKDINLETAKKYARAILSTGAVCKIDPPEKETPDGASLAPSGEVAPPAEVVVPEEDTGRAEPRVVVIQLLKKPEDRFEPLALEKVSGAPNGINLNAADVSEVPYDKILALATFNESNGTEEVTKLYMFISSIERPFVCDIDNIVFSDFPTKVFPKSIASFRGFLHFLCKKNLSIILEETTLDFLSGSQPQKLDSLKAMKLATGMGQLIESGDIDSQT
ncbi:MAG: hypothetical protein HF978_17740 [Desulfobacteraceae bacterium]|nr:hypothetical protein [Desulfobacteraceae bacterium]MBC2757390.1 hypothetical protein [Desulfobacteraceae bacterium]